MSRANRLWMSSAGVLAMLAPVSAAGAESSASPAPKKVASAAESRELIWMRGIVANLQASLIDPESARLGLPFGFTPTLSTWKIWGVQETGFFTCGVVNSRNRMGGYVGNTVFVGIIRPNGSVETTLDSGKSRLLERICEEKRQRGELPSISPDVRKALSG